MSAFDYSRALKCHDMEVVRLSLLTSPQLLSQSFCDCLSPAQLAATYNDVELMKLIYEIDPKATSATGCCRSRLRHPATIATTAGHTEILEYIEEKEVPVYMQ